MENLKWIISYAELRLIINKILIIKQLFYKIGLTNFVQLLIVQISNFCFINFVF